MEPTGRNTHKGAGSRSHCEERGESAGTIDTTNQVALDPDEHAARTARGVVRRFLTSIRSPVDPESAALLTTELVTNAVRHGEGNIILTVQAMDPIVRITVSDEGTGVPSVRAPDPNAAHGRGLQLIEMIAARWGVDVGPERKQVWFEL